MKKLFAILLSAALLVSMFVVFAPATAEPVNAALTATVDATATNQGANGFQGSLNDGVYGTGGTGADDDYAGNTGWFAYTACWSLEQHLDPINTVKVDDTYSLGTATLTLDDSYNVSDVKISVGGGNRWAGDVFCTPTFIKVYASADNGATWGAAVEADLSNLVAGHNLVSVAVNAEANAIKVEVGVVNETRALISEIEVWGTVVEDVVSSSSSAVESTPVESTPSESTPVESTPSESTPSESTPVVSLEDQLKDKVGADNEGSVFDFVINAPETYVPGESITVEITVNKTDASVFLGMVEGQLIYDNSVLTLTNDIKNNILQAFDEKAHTTDDYEWENWCKITGDNQIEISALTDAIADGIDSFSDELTFVLTFDVAAEATGEIGFYFASSDVCGYLADDAMTDVLGNGAYDIMDEYVAPAPSSSSAVSSEVSSAVSSEVSSEASSVVSSESSEPATDVEPGDASVGFVVFAILAVVAIAGSAVVIKSRR